MKKLTELARADRPFLVVTGTLLRPKNPNKDLQRFRFDMTPLYVGRAVSPSRAPARTAELSRRLHRERGFDSVLA